MKINGVTNKFCTLNNVNILLSQCAVEYFKLIYGMFIFSEMVNKEIEMGPQPPLLEDPNGAAQCTEQPVTQHQPSPTKLRLRKKIKVLRTKVNRLTKRKTKDSASNHDIHNVCCKLEKLLPVNTAKFIRSQIKVNQLKNRKGMRWTLDDKMFALSVFYHSRKAYRLLGKIFTLPCKSTLTKLLGQSKIYPGFNDNIFQAIKTKVQTMSQKDRQCVLLFDEMSIKCSLSYNRYQDSVEGTSDFGTLGKTKLLANTALVFMVRGLAEKWKQCIGYFLSAGPVASKTLKDLTMQAVDKLTEVGLNVKVIICDQGSNNRSFLETQLKVSVEKPYITYADRKIHIIYDPPHLLKNIRNNLKKHNFLHNNVTIDWWHIVNFYNFDKGNDIRLAPKLSDDHITLPMFTKMRVKLAAQVLSHSVAAGISTLSRLSKLPPEAKHTADFINFRDKLFNCFNSNSRRSSKPLGQAVSDNTDHLAFLKGALEYLNDLKLPNGKTLPCISGWQISIKSLIELWPDLRDQHMFEFLLTNRLNQDCLENLFSIIRGKGGKRDNPDAREFRAAYRQVVFDQILLPSQGSNCEMDRDGILLSLANINMSSNVPNPSTIAKTSSPSNEVNNNDVYDVDSLVLQKTHVSLPVRNVEAYMAGYLIRKSQIIECDDCKYLFQSTDAPNSEIYTFLHEKSHGKDTLIFPTESFVKVVEEWEATFKTCIDNVIHMNGVLQRLFRYAKNSCQGFSCNKESCNIKVQAMMKLYMKVPLHAAIKKFNKCLVKASSGKRNRKLLKLQHL